MLHTLDSAIRSRFEEEIEFTLPTLEERREILEYYAGTFPKKLGKDVDIDALAKLTQGFSGRDLVEKLLKNALHKAILTGGKVKMSHFEEALSESLCKRSEPREGCSHNDKKYQFNDGGLKRSYDKSKNKPGWRVLSGMNRNTTTLSLRAMLNYGR